MKTLAIFGIVVIAFQAMVSPSAEQTLDDPIQLMHQNNPATPDRKLADSSSLDSFDPSIYLRLISPDEQQQSLMTVQAKRLLYLRRNDRWVTRLLSKLDRMKFIINSRLETLGDSVTHKLKNKGLSPLIKFHRIYNQMMNPITNPFLQMNVSNKILASPNEQADPQFQQFQNNLHEYAESYANSLAQHNSGIFDLNNPRKV